MCFICGSLHPPSVAAEPGAVSDQQILTLPHSLTIHKCAAPPKTVGAIYTRPGNSSQLSLLVQHPKKSPTALVPKRFYLVAAASTALGQ